MDVSLDDAAISDWDDEVDFGPFETKSTPWLELEICRWAANLTAAESRLLSLIAEFDRRQGWRQYGNVSCAKWLQDRTGFDRSTAHEKVRVAHALDQFPSFKWAMSAGVLSYAKVRAITRIATEDNADMLLKMALDKSSHQVERFVQAYRRCEEAADDVEARAFAERSLSYRTDDASMVITIRVPVEAGAAFISSVDQFVSNTEFDTPQIARRADAAIEMAEHAVANIAHSGGVESKYLVTLHLSPDVFHEEDGDGDEDDEDVESSPEETSGANRRSQRRTSTDHDRRNICCIAPGSGVAAQPKSVSRKTAERILCDAAVQGFKIDDSGGVAVGADSRYPSGKLRRALLLRDEGCMAPGCDRLGWLHAHHIVHWTNKGPTIDRNLVCLCRFHHRMVHEGGWWITGDANIPDGLEFHRPDGSIVPGGQTLVAGCHDPVEDIGCTHTAVMPGASVQEQRNAIAAARMLRVTLRGLFRERQSAAA